MNRLLLLLLFLLPSFSLLAQSTRPYFQQEVKYTIDVRLNDRRHALSANISIEYLNNSPDTLRELWFHLWPNGYRDCTTALCKQKLESGSTALYFSEPEERGYIDSLDFTTNGRKLDWKYDARHKDICLITLAAPLPPGQRTTIATPFYVKIPDAKFSRLGHAGQAYAITQWYPKPAVYDRYGWHPMPYLDQGEFYSEYGSFDVTITLPSNYVVAATGELQTLSEIEALNSRAQAERYASEDSPFPESSTTTKTIRYLQDSIHDFAWFADKRFQVSKGEVILPKSGRKVTTWTMYSGKDQPVWKESIRYLNQAVLFYSEKVGEYPYAHCTAVAGPLSAGGGMEYPMVTIIGRMSNPFDVDVVIAHEVGHNWFYGILGSNEREHPWMDEGLNSSLESRYVLHHYPVEKYGNVNQLSNQLPAPKLLRLNRFNYEESNLFTYQIAASIHTDQPIELPSDQYSDLNYGIIVYTKTAVAMNYLRSYLGETLYDRCMHTYFDEWKFRHPYPADLKEVFSRVSGKNLDWFFEGMLRSTRQQDFRIRQVDFGKQSAKFTVEQVSGNNAPFQVAGYQNGKLMTTQWFEPDQAGKSLTISCDSCTELVIDPGHVMLENNYRNNRSRRLPPKLRLFPNVSLQDRNYVYVTPVGGWNEYNRWMAGISIYNSFVPWRNFEYAITPLYSFHSKKLTGTARLDYTIYPKMGAIQEIKLSNQFRTFNYGTDSYLNQEKQLVSMDLSYIRNAPTVSIQFKEKDPRSSKRRVLTFQSVHLWEENIVYNFSNDRFQGSKETVYKDFYRLRYSYQNNRRLDPFYATIGTEANKDLLKGDLEAGYAISYKKRNKQASIRTYLGYGLVDKADGRYSFFLSDRNAARGSTDYAYDDYYFGRSATEGVLFQQMALRQGAFKAYSPLGSYRNFIAAVNINIDLPVPLPIRLYADLGTTEGFRRDMKAVYDLNQSFSYNAGICIGLAKEIIDVYFPLFKSTEIKKYNETNNIRFSEEIRFVFNLHRLNPLNIRNQFRD